MFTIDFGSATKDITAQYPNRDPSSWKVPVFDFIDHWYDEDVESIQIHTSGSTGVPKVISHSRTAMMASAERTCDFFGIKEGEVALLALPAAYIGGKMMITRSIVRRLRLICVEPKADPLRGLEYDEEIDFASFTPMQMSTILSHSSSAHKLSRIRLIILGGGEVSATLREHLQDVAPEVYETYGMTETISHIALKKLNGPDRSDEFTTLPGVKIAQDARGCLVISAPHLAAGDIVTNDIVELTGERLFRWIGRYDNVINTGGVKVYAEEIERKLQPYVGVAFFVTGMADEVLGQTVTLVVEGIPVNIDEVNAHLEKFEKVRKVLVVDRFVYTESGKVNKRETISGSTGTPTTNHTVKS